MSRRLLFCAGALLLAAAPLPLGCSDPADPPAESATGGVVFGVTSDLRAGVDLKTMHVVTKAAGAVVTDEVLRADNDTLRFPLELPMLDLPDGTEVEVTLEAFGGVADEPLVTRSASTRVVANQKLLVRVAIEAECIALPGNADLPCAAPLTCVGGVCRDAAIEPGVLEAYAEGWAQIKPDTCKPIGAGDPMVLVGEGQTDYFAIDDGAVAQIEAGPQGGYHVWIAVRVKNLKQSGSITTLTGRLPDLDRDVPPFAVIFSFDPDEGGYCKLAGLRFQLASSEPEVTELLGQKLEVTATIEDADGAVATGKRTVQLADTYVEP